MLLALLLCVFLGCVFTQSSATLSPLRSDSPEVFVAGQTEESADPVSLSDAQPDLLTEDSQETETQIAVTSTPTPSPTKDPSRTPALLPEEESRQVSPEASKGVWTPSGSNWMFLVDGVPYKGWLCDTDKSRYFFNEDGYMQRGWLDEGEKRYYLNMDGIMQTGDITVDGKTYHLNADGSLKGYKSRKPKTEKKSSDKKKAADKKKKAAPKEKKYAALTFDDGPSSFTGRLLDCLEEHQVKATFFMVGTEINSFPEEVKRIARQGHELGNHTYDHLELTALSLSETQSEIGKVDQALLALTGQGASVVRPPYGAINDNVKASVGTPMILWSIDTLDWKTQNAQQTVDTVMNEIKDGSIILMHDIYSTTVDAVEQLLPKLLEEGYELVTVHELAKLKGIDLKPGIAYGEMQ